MASQRNRKVFTGLTMASSLAWMSILPATAVMAQSMATVTPASVHLSGPLRPTNGSATFTASASDPNGTAEYQFWVQSPNGQWSDMQNYSTRNTFTLATPSQGDYLVVVDVMDQAQVAAGDWSMAQTTMPDGVFNGSTVSVASSASGEVSKGTPVTLTASSSGIFSPLYQFWYQDPSGTWHQSGAYQSSNSYTFTAGMSGTYKFVAFAKSPQAANDQHGALQSSVGTQVSYGTASQVVLTPASGSVVANGSATDMLTATVEDRHGDVVANFSGTVNVLETNPQTTDGKLFHGLGSGSVTLTNGSGMIAMAPTATDGNYTYTLVTDNLQSAATSAGGTAGQGQVANVTYGSATVMTTAPSDNRLNLQSSLPNLESNQVSSATVWVQLEDSTGALYKTAHGQLVTLTLGGTASGSFSAASGQTTETIRVPSGASQFPVTVFSQKGKNGTITVQAQSGDQSVTPLVPASISIPVDLVGTPAAVDVSQIGNSGSYTLYQADVVDSHGHTISVGTGSVGTMSVADTSASGSGTLGYAAASATLSGWSVSSTVDTSPTPANLSNDAFTQGMMDFAVATQYNGNGQPLTITATASDATTPGTFSAVSGSTTWHFAPPTAGYTESLPRLAGKEVTRYSVLPGATTTTSAQLTDQYGNPVQEAGQPIWFTLQDSGVMALPNGASGSGDTYETFTNSQGVASITLTALPSATLGTTGYVTSSGALGGGEYTPRYTVVSSANYATQMTLSNSAGPLNGATITVPAGTPLSTVTATLANALGGTVDAPLQLLYQSTNSGVVAFGSGALASGSHLEAPPNNDGVYPFAYASYESGDGMFAGRAGTATITVTDVSNAAMPSASFTVRVVPGAPLTTPWIEYHGQHVSSTNQVPLPQNTPVELQVVNVDAGGNPIAVAGTTPLAVELPALPSGEYWQASRGGFSSSSMTVDIPPTQSSANVWLVSTTSSQVSGPAFGQDLSAEAMATGATVVDFTQATSSTNGSMTIDVAYNAPLASGTVAASSAFAVADTAVTSATLSAAAAQVSGTNLVALTVAIPSGSADASVDPFNSFTVTTSASAVDSTANGSDYATAPLSVSTSGAVALPGLPTADVAAAAAGESQSLNQPSVTASASVSGTSYTAIPYAAEVIDFATLSQGSARVQTPAIVSGAAVSGVANQTVALWPSSGAPSYYLDLTNEAPPSVATGAAYVGFTFTGATGAPVSVWSPNSAGSVVSDQNTSATDYIYVPVATGATSGPAWTLAPAKTVTDWVEVNGTFYTFTTTQP